MASLFMDSCAGAGRFAAAAAAAAALCAMSFGLQGCAISRGSGSDGDEFGWGDDGILPAANADADGGRAEAVSYATAAEPTPVESAEEEDDGDIVSLPNVVRATDSDTGIFKTDESAAAIGSKAPVIGRGYRLQVTVMVGDNNEVGPMEVLVSEKEEITLPLVGRVPCGGLTIEALHSRLAGRYAEFFADPEVIVSFAYSEDGISPYGQVLVQGRVHREGWVNIPPTRNLRLSHAIQRCGGFSSSALRSSVRVTRRLDDGTVNVFKINFKDIGKKGALEKDILLEPNDVVYVDESNF